MLFSDKYSKMELIKFCFVIFVLPKLIDGHNVNFDQCTSELECLQDLVAIAGSIQPVLTTIQQDVSGMRLAVVEIKPQIDALTAAMTTLSSNVNSIADQLNHEATLLSGGFAEVNSALGTLRQSLVTKDDLSHALSSGVIADLSTTLDSVSYTIDQLYSIMKLNGTVDTFREYLEAIDSAVLYLKSVPNIYDDVSALRHKYAPNTISKGVSYPGDFRRQLDAGSLPSRKVKTNHLRFLPPPRVDSSELEYANDS